MTKFYDYISQKGLPEEHVFLPLEYHLICPSKLSYFFDSFVLFEETVLHE